MTAPTTSEAALDRPVATPAPTVPDTSQAEGSLRATPEATEENAAQSAASPALDARPAEGSYFVNQMRQQARRDAAPADIHVLLDTLADYLPPHEVEEIERAYHFAESYHGGQFRRTGHAYITHPLAVAHILAEMRMDHQSVMAAIMHDVLEDTDASKSALAEEFGEEVADIVDGVSKLGSIFQSRAEAQAENFQKMAMATARDLRVILVKLADRLHNMRTIGVMPPESRRRIARETLDYYAPIANRLGMNLVRVEFEDLGFQALYPLRADRIRRAVESKKGGGNRKALMSHIRETLQGALRREGIEAEVVSREKHLYSIYRKMKTQRKSFHNIMDVFGFRILVAQADTCYRALGVVHNTFKPVAGRFKDYIAIPKANGYQSLHTTLFGMNAVPIEVQIRTRAMDTVAENGIAGHWLYKDDGSGGSQVRARQWVAGLLDLQQRAGNSLEFIESLKIDLFPDEVYVFTPAGDILELPRGACPIDFAYTVHTDIGNHCVSARVDRVQVPLSQQLESGQTVEIVTAPSARPNPDWLTFTVSIRARSAIRQALKVQRRSESIRLGRTLLDRSLTNAGTSIKQLDFRRLRKVFREFDTRKLDDLLEKIGMGDLLAYMVAQKLLEADNPDYEAVDIDQGGPVAIRGGEGLVITYARCCGPVPGEPVAGHVTSGKGLVVHVETCPNVADLRRRTPRELIPVRWSDTTHGEFDTVLLLTVRRRKGVIAELASTANQVDAGISNLTVDEHSSELSSVRLALSVSDKDHLQRVERRLMAIPAVQNVLRPIHRRHSGAREGQDQH